MLSIPDKQIVTRPESLRYWVPAQSHPLVVNESLSSADRVCYGTLPEVFYELFPRLALSGIAEKVSQSVGAIEPYYSHDDKAQVPTQITGSVGKMIVAGGMPAGWYTPRKVFREALNDNPLTASISEYGELAHSIIDLDLRFVLKEGINIYDLEPVIRKIVGSEEKIIRSQTGSFSALNIYFGDKLKLDLGELPKSWEEVADNHRTSWAVCAKDAFVTAEIVKGLVFADRINYRLLFGKDTSLSLIYADVPLVVNTALRTSFTNALYPPTSYEAIGGADIWEDMERPEMWQIWEAHSRARPEISTTRLREISKGFLLNLTANPDFLSTFPRRLLRLFPINDLIQVKGLPVYSGKQISDYFGKFYSGSLKFAESGVSLTAQFFNISPAELPQQFTLSNK